MDFFELMDVAHKYLEVLNPSSEEKLMAVGEILDLLPGNRVIDFGSGKGEMLCLLADKYGISGTGIDLSEGFCAKAVQKIADRGFSQQIEIINTNGNSYKPAQADYDVAMCIGATFIWDGYRSAIQAMRDCVRADGKLVIGEVHWLKKDIPKEFLDASGLKDTLYEHEILQVTMEEGYEIEYLVRSSLDDWDRYNAGNWHGLVRWLDENPGHPDRQQVLDFLHKGQQDYLKYEREYVGWAIYVLNPVSRR
ncbi:MAG: methyltransferase domain-containing protein [Dehalococcoidales bacterium]|nr:methyltransferase domain-containing protein [Dehalococcoidales bacterium]